MQCETCDILSIKSISPTRTLLSAPALSLDRLKIELKGGNVLVISPKKKQEFIEELRKINSEIEANF